MRNLLINLTFIFILILGGASDAIAQRGDTKGNNVAGGGIIDILNFGTSFAGGGIIDILQLNNGGGRVADNVPKVKVNVSTLDGTSLINYTEDYTYTDMQITLPSKEVDALPSGRYLLSVSIDNHSIGQKEIQIE